MTEEKPLSYDEVRQIPTYDQIKYVVERFGNPFERDELRIEEIVSGIFNVDYEEERVYSNVKEQRDPTAAVVAPGEWEMELYMWYIESQK